MKRDIKFRGLIEYISSGKREWVFYGVGSKPSLSGAIWIVEDEQFTGLRDSKGVEVYEGDVVRLSSSVYELYYGPGQIVAIEWDEDSTGFKPFMDGHSDYGGVSGNQCEVIGTIHDAEYKELAK